MLNKTDKLEARLKQSLLNLITKIAMQKLQILKVRIIMELQVQ